MTPVSHSRSSRLTRAAVVAWLLLLTLTDTLFWVAFTRLQQPLQNTAADSVIEELSKRVGALEDVMSAAGREPVNLSLNEFRPLREQWDQRLIQLEQTQQATADCSDLDALRRRLDALENTQKVASQTRTTTTRKAHTLAKEPRRTASAAPDFTPLGIESRGGVRMLAILPKDAAALNQVRLLALGEAQGRWQLQAIEDRSALFRVDQQMRRLNLPQE